jgi:hypothetical protein
MGRIIAWLSAVALFSSLYAVRGTAQERVSGGTAPPKSPPAVIHVHHHYYAPLGTDVTRGDPAARFSPTTYSYEDSAFDALPSLDRNWGDLGLFAYLGQQGDNDGLIVSRVTPSSPAAKLGLVRGDIILQINDVEVGDLSFRELQALFVRLSTTPKIKVTMQVWNVLTQRDDTLQSEFINDPPDSNEDNNLRENQ